MLHMKYWDVIGKHTKQQKKKMLLEKKRKLIPNEYQRRY